jgi:hypothetical protein
MDIDRPEDLLSLLGETGPISVEDLVTRTGTDLSKVATDLENLIEAGDIDVEKGRGETLRALRLVLSEFKTPKEKEGEQLSFGPGSVRRDFFNALKNQDAYEAKVSLSPRGFRKVKSLLR